MNPFVWIGIGLGLLLLPKKAPAAPLLPDTTPSGPPPEGQVSVAIPSGWRRLSTGEVTPDLLSASRQILSAHGGDPYGTLVPIDSAHAALIEQHYHEPGGPVKPWGFHHGVTLLVQSTARA